MRIIGRLIAVLGAAVAALALSLTAASAAPATSSSPLSATANSGDVSIEGLCNYNGGHPLLREGDVGVEVAHAQCLLRRVWGFDIAMDGIFGPQTFNTVIVFQIREGITIDGIIGPVTWDHLHP